MKIKSVNLTQPKKWCKNGRQLSLGYSKNVWNISQKFSHRSHCDEILWNFFLKIESKWDIISTPFDAQIRDAAKWGWPWVFLVGQGRKKKKKKGSINLRPPPSENDAFSLLITFNLSKKISARIYFVSSKVTSKP